MEQETEIETDKKNMRRLNCLQAECQTLSICLVSLPLQNNKNSINIFLTLVWFQQHVYRYTSSGEDFCLRLQIMNLLKPDDNYS